jgi:acyl-coenzyme A thioesterase PaaI-like protein
MVESLQTRVFRWGMNLVPCYWGTGARITYIAADYQEVRVTLPLSWRTRNYMGTIFGGSMYGAIDPVYVLMLIKTLGPQYVVWDKAALIRFRKPGRTCLYARFTICAGEIYTIKANLRKARSIDRVYQVDLCDRNGVVHASVEKTIYIRRKDGLRQPQPAV